MFGYFLFQNLNQSELCKVTVCYAIMSRTSCQWTEYGGSSCGKAGLPPFVDSRINIKSQYTCLYYVQNETKNNFLFHHANETFIYKSDKKLHRSINNSNRKTKYISNFLFQEFEIGEPIIFLLLLAEIIQDIKIIHNNINC